LSRGPGLVDPDLIDAARMADVVGQTAEEADGSMPTDHAGSTGIATSSRTSRPNGVANRNISEL